MGNLRGGILREYHPDERPLTGDDVRLIGLHVESPGDVESIDARSPSITRCNGLLSPIDDLPTGHSGQLITVLLVAAVTVAVPEITGETIRNKDGWRLLLVRIHVSNPKSDAHSLPVGSLGDVSVIAADCVAQTIGEPDHNCTYGFIDGPFTEEEWGDL